MLVSKSVRALSSWGAVFSLLALSACGGGGSDSAGPTMTDKGAVALSSSNADEAARAALQAGNVSNIALSMTDMTLGSSQQTVNAVAGRAHALAVRASGSHRQLQATANINCSVSGTIKASLSDKNGNGVMDLPGESLTIIATNCNEGTGAVMNGGFTLGLASYTSSSNYTLSFRFDAFSVAVTATGNVAMVDGDLQATVSGGNQFAVSATSFIASATDSGVTRQVGLSNYTASVTNNGSSASSTVNGKVIIGALDQHSVTLSTLTPFVTLSTDQYPSSGQMKLVGASGSTVLATALSATQVQLSIDADGNGEYETIRTVNWADLN